MMSDISDAEDMIRSTQKAEQDCLHVSNISDADDSMIHCMDLAERNYTQENTQIYTLSSTFYSDCPEIEFQGKCHICVNFKWLIVLF
jgi:hypothetical protein